MSRSTSVWVVQDELETVIAAFTVRHEMVSWLESRPGIRHWVVLQVPDNPKRYRAKPIQKFVAEDFLLPPVLA